MAATAARIFREKGFRGASLADVAESLGTDPRIALLLHRQQRRAVPRDRPGRRRGCRPAAEEIRDGAGSAAGKLGRLITSLMATYSARYPYLYVYIQEDLSKVGDRRSAGHGR